MKLATWLFGAASVIAGILDLIWREFEPAHQPIQAWSDHIPGITVLACIAAVWLIAGGLALLVRPAARAGAAALAILYSIFVLFPLPRLYTAPHYLGRHFGVYNGVLVSVSQQLVLVIAALCVWMTLSDRPANVVTTRTLRWVFGLCCIVFGVGHFTALQPTASMLPAWMPFGGIFWSVLSGIAFLAAGLAIVSGILDVQAAGLLAVMFLLFVVLVLTPRALATPRNHVAWGGDAYTLAAVGASGIFSAWLALKRTGSAS
jgi:uncharacterized membrane protein